MDFLHKNQKIILLAFLIGGGLYVYNMFFASDVITTEDVSTTAVGSEVLALYNSLQSVTLSPDLFEDPLYTRLVDFSTNIPPQIPGRANPFAQIGRD